MWSSWLECNHGNVLQVCWTAAPLTLRMARRCLTPSVASCRTFLLTVKTRTTSETSACRCSTPWSCEIPLCDWSVNDDDDDQEVNVRFVFPGTTIIILRSRCCWTLQYSSLRCPRTLVMLDGSKMVAQFCLVFVFFFGFYQPDIDLCGSHQSQQPRTSRESGWWNVPRTQWVWTHIYLLTLKQTQPLWFPLACCRDGF